MQREINEKRQELLAKEESLRYVIMVIEIFLLFTYMSSFSGISRAVLLLKAPRQISECACALPIRLSSFTYYVWKNLQLWYSQKGILFELQYRGPFLLVVLSETPIPPLFLGLHRLILRMVYSSFVFRSPVPRLLYPYSVSLFSF